MQAIIIAAGESSRFWPLNQNHKTAFSLLGKPILYWTIKGLIESGVQDIVVVCAKGSTLPEILKKENIEGATLRFAFQEKPLGTGNALFTAKEFVTKPFFVMWPNKTDSKELVAKMLKEKNEQQASAVVVGAHTDTPWDYGIARMANGSIAEIVENPEKGKEPSNIKVIGSYFFEPDFFSYYEKLPRHHEADFVDAINAYLKDKKTALIDIGNDATTLKYPWDLFKIVDMFFASSNFTHSISPNATIGKNVAIQGPVFIGNGTVIKDNTVIEGPCFIGNNCVVGYSNVLRGPLVIENNVMTGTFFEIKHSIVQEGTHFHSGYVGDSIIGKNCRFGAGFATANRRFDRANIATVVKGQKFNIGTSYAGAVIGDETKFGIHAGIMPGVLIGSKCMIGPGVHVFKNVEDGKKMI